MASAHCKKILIINCYFPEMREPVKRINEVPNSLAPVLLAGYFDAEHCEVKLYNEVHSGFVEVYAPQLLSWPDMVVLTSLSAAYDRLLHVTAYVKSANPEVVVAAGGHAVRSLPGYSQKFFDYACFGDVEEIREVIHEALGNEYVSSKFNPRYDLAYWMNRIGYIESSRNCNFRCGFCSLTGAGRPYEVADLGYLEKQLDSVGNRKGVFFNDNQLCGDGSKTFRQRIDLVRQRMEQGQYDYWGGFVTDTFFWDEDNISFAHETNCLTLFVGVESFADEAWLGKVNKSQNAKYGQVDLIRRSLDGGILFQYGLVFDPVEQTVDQMYQEMDIICDNPEVPLPLFIFTAIPFPGTPIFKERFEAGQILPGTGMRDLESSTLCVQPRDSVERVVEFIKTGKNFRNYRGRAVRHQREFLKRYKDSLNSPQKLISSLSVAAILYPGKFSSPGSLLMKQHPRTHVSTTERLDEVYSPRLHVDSQYQHYFDPTIIIDDHGELNPDLQDDVLASPDKVRILDTPFAAGG